MKTLTFAAAGGLLLTAIAGACWTWSAHSAQPAAPAPRARAVDGHITIAANDPRLSYLKIAAVDAGVLPVAEPVAGRIAYDETRTSRIASPVLGRVTGQRVEIGDSVRAGDLLAELDSPDLAGAQADARKADADEERKRLALARARMLLDADVLARKDYENADADYRQADAEARRARQRIANLHARAAVDGRFGLRAPIAGIVADKQINVGQEVRPDQPNPLLVISDLRHVWAIADVPERVAASLKRGQTVSVETDAWPGQAMRGTIDRIGVAVDPVTRRVQVRCALDNADGRLKPDMFARIAFLQDGGAARALALPNTALFTDGDDTYVYVQRAAGTFEKRRVHVALGGAQRSFVDAGLHPREQVVTEGALLLNAEGENHAG
ncbi:efflux RND transporter periplasmic adaptor subunit [Massilia sp. TW-1]|uniref:Efflux RND transporter periplasmic adaptor subunit n=1 Tax=Telluria antibiotica TaxID=2717319 RepID=A0ABX0P742_9BURK|nr:efflux RND transporter periplasmic adaptor subunit [Telluria antibiotica]NIA53041.1 efflux RND transporter periplasmic adaptor subunit [Telluria antibiotica]